MSQSDKSNMEKITFWKNVETLRKQQGITQEELCSDSGVNVYTYRNWINRGIFPDVYCSVNLAQKLNTSVEYLITGKDPEIKDRSSEVIEAVEKALQQFK